MTLISAVSLASRRITRQASSHAVRPVRVGRVHVSSSSWSHASSHGAGRSGSASFTSAVQEADDQAEDPPRRQAVVHLDFFGEPVTFLEAVSAGSSSGSTWNESKSISAALAAADGHLLTVASRGVSCTGGGREAGLTNQATHAAAQSWAEALRFASVWRERAPMLTVTAVAPVLAQTGAAYLASGLDPSLALAQPAAPGMPVLQCLALAKEVVQATLLEKDNPDGDVWNPRERWHLRTLAYLVEDQHPAALSTLLRALQECPGDILALSIALDLAQTTGQRWAAGRAASSVSSYWQERRGGLVRPSLPGYSLASCLVATGWAIVGRTTEAEALVDRHRHGKVCGAVAAWALAHIYDSQGRTSEGISALANFDGLVLFEAAGWLYTADRWAAYGARFSLDREERGRGKSAALRLYEAHVSRVLEATGYGMGQAWKRPRQPAPVAWLDQASSRAILLEATQTGGTTQGGNRIRRWYDQWFGSASKGSQDDKEGDKEEDARETLQKETYELVTTKDQAPSRNLENWTPSAEDVLTWLPPTPLFLAEATILLFRLTLNGTLSRKNERWEQIRKAWRVTVERQEEAGMDLTFCPLAAVAASMVLPPDVTGGDDVCRPLAQGLHLMGHLMQLGQEAEAEAATATTSTVVVRDLIAEREPDFWLPAKDDQEKLWKEVVDNLRVALDGYDEQHDMIDPQLRFETVSWEMDARPLLDHAVVYAACKAGDISSLSLARSICSQGVSLRPNSPEEWWRYSIVLGLLGDRVASEDALNTSINVGGGQGARR